IPLGQLPKRLLDLALACSPVDTKHRIRITRGHRGAGSLRSGRLLTTYAIWDFRGGISSRCNTSTSNERCVVGRHAHEDPAPIGLLADLPAKPAAAAKIMEGGGKKPAADVSSS